MDTFNENFPGETPPIRARPVTSYVEEVRKLWGKSVEDVLKVAKLCAEAVKVLNQGELRSFKNGLPFKKSKLSKLVKVGSDRRLPAITEILPAGYTILYEIACLSDPVFDRAIEEGVIHPDLQKGEIEKWRLKEAREDRPKRFASIFQLTETSETKKLAFRNALSRLASGYPEFRIKT
jgi:hypothetical protein